MEEIRAASYVGFDSITQQIEHKLLKRGFQFNVIVVGEYSPYLCDGAMLEYGGSWNMRAGNIQRARKEYDLCRAWRRVFPVSFAER